MDKRRIDENKNMLIDVRDEHISIYLDGEVEDIQEIYGINLYRNEEKKRPGLYFHGGPQVAETFIKSTKLIIYSSFENNMEETTRLENIKQQMKLRYNIIMEVFLYLGNNKLEIIEDNEDMVTIKIGSNAIYTKDIDIYVTDIPESRERKVKVNIIYNEIEDIDTRHEEIEQILYEYFDCFNIKFGTESGYIREKDMKLFKHIQRRGEDYVDLRKELEDKETLSTTYKIVRQRDTNLELQRNNIFTLYLALDTSHYDLSHIKEDEEDITDDRKIEIILNHIDFYRILGTFFVTTLKNYSVGNIPQDGENYISNIAKEIVSCTSTDFINCFEKDVTTKIHFLYPFNRPKRYKDTVNNIKVTRREMVEYLNNTDFLRRKALELLEDGVLWNNTLFYTTIFSNNPNPFDIMRAIDSPFRMKETSSIFKDILLNENPNKADLFTFEDIFNLIDIEAGKLVEESQEDDGYNIPPLLDWD